MVQPYRLTPEANTPDAEALARIAALTHSPDVIGNPATSGVPTGWARRLPDPLALPQSDVKVGRNRKGTTRKVRGLWPEHKVTVGDPHYIDPVVDMVAAPTDCSELGLQRAADALLSMADPEGWPRLLGSKRGHHEQLPEYIPTDASSGGATSIDDDDYVDPVLMMRRRHARWSGAMLGHAVAETTVSRKRGKVVRVTTFRDVADDEPRLRPVTLPLCAEANGSSAYGDNGTSLRGQHRTRVTIRRANRLRACQRPYRVRKDGQQAPGTHREGCTCQHDAAGITVLGTAVQYDRQGTPRKVQLLGRRDATVTRVVGWGETARQWCNACDRSASEACREDHATDVIERPAGYWLGHQYVSDGPRPAVVKAASAITRKRNRKADRERKAAARAAARASDAARLDRILGPKA